MMQLNGTARQLIWKLCLYSLITTSNSLNQAFVRSETVLCSGSAMSFFAVANTPSILLSLNSDDITK